MATYKRSIYVQQLINKFWHFPKNRYLSLKAGSPGTKLKCIGVTGTDGKTSTCVLLYHILKEAGYNVGLISTIGAKIGDKWLDTQLHMTAPDPVLIQKILKQMVSSEIEYVILETTSMALDQYRYLGVSFEIGIFTNLAQEHLDYHKTMDNYLASKAKLFRLSKYSILNVNDTYINKLQKILEGKTQIITYGVDKQANFVATNPTIDQEFLTFKYKHKTLKTNSPYLYQLSNIMACIACCSILNISDDVVEKVITNYPETKGRRELIANDLGLRVIIDFAHTPQAIEKTCESLLQTTKGNLIIIFGATGDRDQDKRPLMGKLATQNANLTILTTDDTRTEKIEDINSQIISGITDAIEYKLQKNLPNSKEVIEIAKLISSGQHIYIATTNRQDAITTAILLAKKGDTVIACGKGHEKTILLGKTEYPWSEAEAFRTAFLYKLG